MKYYENKFDQLITETINTLQTLIRSKGIDSKHSNVKCLKINNEEFQFNSEGGRYIKEVHEFAIVDNDGYSFGFDIISTEELMKITDHLIEVNK